MFLSPSLESFCQLRVASQAEIPVCVADTGLTGNVAAELKLTITLFNHLYNLCSVTPSTAKILTAIPSENEEILAIIWCHTRHLVWGSHKVSMSPKP
eukprot:sb/3478976/